MMGPGLAKIQSRPAVNCPDMPPDLVLAMCNSTFGKGQQSVGTGIDGVCRGLAAVHTPQGSVRAAMPPLGKK
jgi:hypothetical protein